jgi:hypothetical protein
MGIGRSDECAPREIAPHWRMVNALRIAGWFAGVMRAAGSLALIVAALALVAPPAASAQAPVTVRGVAKAEAAPIYEKFPLLVVTANGETVAVDIAINLRRILVDQADHGVLVAGAYADAQGTLGADGTLHAQAIVVQPKYYRLESEAMLAPALARDPGRVGGVIDHVDRAASTLALRGDGVLRQVSFDDATRIARMELDPHLGGMVLAGEHVVIAGTRQRDGTLTAGSVYVGKGGYVPPF